MRYTDRVKKITNITAGTMLVPVVSFTLAHGPVHSQADEYVRPLDHTEERPAAAPERLVGKVSMIIPTSSGDLWSGPFPCSWPPLPPLDGPSTPFTLA